METHSLLKSGQSVDRSRVIWAGLLCLALPAAVLSADFNVTTPGFFYSINGTNPNPVITVVRGKTYTFAVNSARYHPFQILSEGVSNNNISSGIVTWTVPLVASNYQYHCSIHLFGNQIVTVASEPPPPIRIVALSVGTNITLLSTGNGSSNIIPEFKTNLGVTNWSALSVQTNSYFNGTNDTICRLPQGSPIFIRIRSEPE
jgi:hypothetical protein